MPKNLVPWLGILTYPNMMIITENISVDNKHIGKLWLNKSKPEKSVFGNTICKYL